VSSRPDRGGGFLKTREGTTHHGFDEAESWLTSLDATVHGVNIRKAD